MTENINTLVDLLADHADYGKHTSFVAGEKDSDNEGMFQAKGSKTWLKSNETYSLVVPNKVMEACQLDTDVILAETSNRGDKTVTTYALRYVKSDVGEVDEKGDYHSELIDLCEKIKGKADLVKLDILFTDIKNKTKAKTVTAKRYTSADIDLLRSTHITALVQTFDALYEKVHNIENDVKAGRKTSSKPITTVSF